MEIETTMEVLIGDEGKATARTAHRTIAYYDQEHMRAVPWTDSAEEVVWVVGSTRPYIVRRKQQ